MPGETFFTVVGCMDGRVQDVVARFGQQKFGAKFPDTITEAGIVGKITDGPDERFIQDLKSKLLVSVEKHHSKGVVVDGHEECAGNPVADDKHKQDVRTSVEFVNNLIENKVPVIGVFVQRGNGGWIVEQV